MTTIKCTMQSCLNNRQGECIANRIMLAKGKCKDNTSARDVMQHSSSRVCKVNGKRKPSPAGKVLK